MGNKQLKSLFVVLRAAGVTEFADAKTGVQVKLGAAPVTPVAVGKSKRNAVDAQTRQVELAGEILASKRAQQELLKLGVDAETAARELADVS